jgi:hypothetical protein
VRSARDDHNALPTTFGRQATGGPRLGCRAVRTGSETDDLERVPSQAQIAGELKVRLSVEDHHRWYATT